MSDHRFSECKKAINVTLDESIVERIDSEAERIGLKRSQYINMIMTKLYQRKDRTDGKTKEINEE